MNAPLTAVATETQKIEDALDRLLTAITWADRQPSTTPDDGPTSAGELIGRVLLRLETWTAAQQAADALMRRPASEALRQAVTTLGKRLHEIGGMALMRDVCDRVAERDPANESRRLGVIDHRWDGIGDWYA